MKSFSLLIFATALFVAGIACLIYPERIRSANIQLRGKRIVPMPPVMKRRQEIWSIRLSGTVALLMSLFLCWTVWASR
jgi:hypothetical protein